VEDTLKALEMGAVETLICWENLDIQVSSFLMCLKVVRRGIPYADSIASVM
jgi:hypothetical protein